MNEPEFKLETTKGEIDSQYPRVTDSYIETMTKYCTWTKPSFSNRDAWFDLRDAKYLLEKHRQGEKDCFNQIALRVSELDNMRASLAERDAALAAVREVADEYYDSESPSKFAIKALREALGRFATEGGE